MDERYKAVKQGYSWAVYDKKRKCTVMRSVSPNAKYNKAVAGNAAYSLNMLNLTDEY